MYVTSVPNRNSPPAILLRESYRENGKVKNKTIANLSEWDPAKIEALKVLLSSRSHEPLGAFRIVRSLPHGHVAAAMAVAENLDLRGLLAPRAGKERELALALVLQRALDPASKSATSRALSQATATSSLGSCLGLDPVVSSDDVYEALDWLLRRQSGIEKRLAEKHLGEGCVVLYDLTSTWVEGTHCDLAKRGYSRDGVTGKDQIEFALATDRDGRPVAVEVFEGNTSDPATVASAVRKLKDRFGLAKVILVGDRGMLTGARIREDLDPVEGLDYVTALRKPTIQKLLDRGDIQLGLFDQMSLVEIESTELPGSRLVVCRNPHERDAQRQRRQERVNRAVTALAQVRDAVTRADRPLRGEAAIARRVGKVFGRHRGVERFLRVQTTDEGLTFEVDAKEMEAEARLDGLYVVRTSVPKADLSAEEAVRLYKSLARVERSFRAMKSDDIDVRPIFHRRSDRVRAHVLLCMLALYVRRELEARLAPLLYVDEAPDTARPPVSRAAKSDSAKAKAAQHQTPDGMPVQSLRQLLSSLAALTRNFVQMEKGVTEGFWTTAEPTPLQKRALDAVGARL
jgi:hypothetical protein